MLAACHALESVDVEAARLNGVALSGGVVFVASLHVLEHLAAVAVAEVVRGVAKVRLEEVCERGNGRGGCGDEAGGLLGVGGREEDRSRDLELLQVGMQELSG